MMKAAAKLIFHLLPGRRGISGQTSSSEVEPFCLRVMPWHLDLNGHVNNAHYFHYANQARLVYLAQKGVLLPLLANGIKPIIKESHITYLKPLKLLQVFYIETRMRLLQNAEIELTHRFYKKIASDAPEVKGGTKREIAVIEVKAKLLGNLSPIQSLIQEHQNA